MTGLVDLTCPRCRWVKAIGNPSALHTCKNCGSIMIIDSKFPLTEFDKQLISEGGI